MIITDQKALLLNVSNLDGFPVFPYAFIQIPAVARQAGIEVVCKDLLGIPKETWKQTLQTLIRQHDPAMILITLRNTDSLGPQDYEPQESKDENGSAYFPIERTKELIAVIRKVSDLKIALGGFGFSVMPNEIMDYLRPDFGVVGDPNDFFSHFDDIQQENYQKVANLLFFQNNQLISNSRKIFPPFSDTEYTSQVITEMMAFYEAFPSPGFQGAPIEIMRGCNHSCVFCSEPHVKGNQVRYRDLSAVMGDIEILVENGITLLYIVSSELNPEGNEFILELADRIHNFNEEQPEDRKVTWYGANYLLTFNDDEYERLHRSGFTGGWFDITALDDENARAMRTPYRNKDLLTRLKPYAQFKRKQTTPVSKKESSEDDVSIGWTMFLGNPATTLETIRNTLQIANQNGISQYFNQCGIITTIRVFDYEKPDQATLNVTYSVTPELERTHYRQINPSFASPPALLQDFGSADKISQMFTHIAETYLSTKYKKTRDWHNFLKGNATALSIENWMAELSKIKGVTVPIHLKEITEKPTTPALRELFAERLQESMIQSSESLAKQVVDFLLSVCLEAFPNFFESLCLPKAVDDLSRMTPYDLAVAVFDRWSTEKDFFEALIVQTQSVIPEWKRELLQFCAQAILYKFNILIKRKYRPLFTLID